jgi:hypothetical protein
MGEHHMAAETRAYATYKEDCGREQPGVAANPEAIDWTRQETTPDQVRIEAVLDTIVLADQQLLHVGVGNSKLARQFAGRVRGIDGVTIHQNEKTCADSLAIANYTVYLINKYSPGANSVLPHTYDYIIDNNLASFACCKKHFFVMIKNYRSVLRSRGRILTCQIGMDAIHGEIGCTMTYRDLVGLERRFPFIASKLNDAVYALTLRS